MKKGLLYVSQIDTYPYSNYVNGSLFVVKVYKEGQLVGLSYEQIFNGLGAVDFGNVESFNCEGN